MVGYLYLVVDGERFKVGYSNNPRRRQRQYKTHNTNAKIVGTFSVDDKNMERLVSWELLKIGYRKCNRYPRDEWFEGELSLNRLQWIIDCIDARRISWEK